MLLNTYHAQLALLPTAEDPNDVLRQANQTLEALFPAPSDEEPGQAATDVQPRSDEPAIDKAQLARALIESMANTNNRQQATNYAKLALGYPEIVKLFGTLIGSTHPSLSKWRRVSLRITSLLPGEFDFKTGEYTPPPENR